MFQWVPLYSVVIKCVLFLLLPFNSVYRLAILNIRVKSWYQQKQKRPGCIWNCIVITGFTNYEGIFATPGWELSAHWTPTL